MFLNPTTHFHINVSWEWTYDGYHKGHKTKINQNMCGIMYHAMLYSMSGKQKVLGFYTFLYTWYTVTLAHMWLLNNLSSFVKNVIIVKHNTSAIGKTCPSIVLYCFLKYLRECQFFKEIVIFQKSDPFFVIFQTARTLLILLFHWKAMLFWKCLYPYFNIKWLFDVATEVKILLWHTYLLGLSEINHVCQVPCKHAWLGSWGSSSLITDPASSLKIDCQPSDCTEEHYASFPGMEHMPVELRKNIWLFIYMA